VYTDPRETDKHEAGTGVAVNYRPLAPAHLLYVGHRGGAKPQQVQAHLRHKDLKTTMRYYGNREQLNPCSARLTH